MKVLITMKEFDEWRSEHFTEWKDFLDINGKGVVKSQQEMLEEAFKAGMLAAADIADNYAFKIQSKDSAEYAIGNNIGEAIRRKANART